MELGCHGVSTVSRVLGIGPSVVEVTMATITFHYSLAGLVPPSLSNIRLIRRAAEKLLTATKSLCQFLSYDDVALILRFHLLGSTLPS